MALPALLLLLVLAGAVPASTAAPQGRPEPVPQPQGPGPEWVELLERDARAGFSGRSSGSALAELQRPGLDPRSRAVALFALGAGRAHAERARLESWALEGSAIERCAALLALGELDTPEPGLLVRVAGEGGEVGACALLALLRSGRPANLARVRDFARGEGELARAARELLAHREDPRAHAPPAARTLYELRAEAARLHGLVDGRVWSAQVLERLIADRAFLDRVVYRAAGDLNLPGSRDHFLELLLADGGPDAARGAVNAMPVQVAQLVEAELWTPRDEAVWTALLEEIDAQRLEGLTDAVLDRALTVPALRARTALLLVRGGNARGLPLLRAELSAADPPTRAAIARAIGDSGTEALLPLLAPLSEEDSPAQRAAALVAQLRLGLRSAIARIEAGLRLPDALQSLDPAVARQRVELRAALVDELGRAWTHPVILGLLEQHLPGLEDELRLSALAGLCRAGRGTACAELRRTAARAVPRGELGVRIVRAFAGSGAPDDIALLRALFPLEGSPEVNFELALALLDRRDPAVLPLLRAALWQPPLHRSVLAGGLLHELAGGVGLRQELEHPPRGAAPEDVRRVGFALGRWGGLPAAEALAERGSAADPAVQGAWLGALLTRAY